MNHLSSYLSSLNSSTNKLTLSGSVFCFNSDHLTFSDIIILCLSEANEAMKKFLTKKAISPLLADCFDQYLIYISQRLCLAIVLLPFSYIHPDFDTLANELLKQFQYIDFRTFFIEGLISKLSYFLNQITAPVI